MVVAKARRHAAVSGIAVAVLFGLGNAIWAFGMPNAGAPAGEVVDFYGDRSDRIVVGATLSLLSIAAFLWFAAAVRRVLEDAEGDDVLPTTAFAGALLGMAAGLGAESINMVGALRARDDELSDELARSLFEISQIFGSVASAVGLGVFALATAAVALRTGLVLPRVPAIFTGLVGIVLLTPLAHVTEVAGVALVALAVTIAGVFLRSG